MSEIIVQHDQDVITHRNQMVPTDPDVVKLLRYQEQKWRDAQGEMENVPHAYGHGRSHFSCYGGNGIEKFERQVEAVASAE